MRNQFFFAVMPALSLAAALMLSPVSGGQQNGPIQAGSQQAWPDLVRIRANAAGAGQQAEPLSDQLIGRWIASMEDLRHWADTLSDEEREALEIGGPDFETRFARAAEQHEEVRSTIRGHGFSSVDEWARISSRVIWAAIAIQARRQIRNLEEAMEQWEAGEGRDPALDEEQKAIFRHEMALRRHYIESVADSIPPADVTAVARHEGAIRSLDRD